MALGHVTGSKLKQVMLGIFELRLKALVGLTVVYGFTVVIGGSGTDCLTLVREMSRKQESPPSFIFSKWKGQKHRKIP